MSLVGTDVSEGGIAYIFRVGATSQNTFFMVTAVKTANLHKSQLPKN
jgi:hypothetical protein